MIDPSQTSNNIVFFAMIAGKKEKEPLISALTKAGGRLVNIIYGKGSVRTGYLMEALGFVPEEHKVMIVSLIKIDKADALLKTLEEEYHFNQPNTGIAFTMSIEKLSF